jgi:hypothetical protein
VHPLAQSTRQPTRRARRRGCRRLISSKFIQYSGCWRCLFSRNRGLGVDMFGHCRFECVLMDERCCFTMKRQDLCLSFPGEGIAGPAGCLRALTSTAALIFCCLIISANPSPVKRARCVCNPLPPFPPFLAIVSIPLEQSSFDRQSPTTSSIHPSILNISNTNKPQYERYAYSCCNRNHDDNDRR